jgi:branched-chain amino acid aminotransferase
VADATGDDAVTSYQCGDLPDEFGWNWPKEGIVAEDAIRA